METIPTLAAICVENSPVTVNPPKKSQWRGALVFSLICTRTNGWVNSRQAGDLRHHRAIYYVIVMIFSCGKHSMTVCPSYLSVYPSQFSGQYLPEFSLKFHEIFWKHSPCGTKQYSNFQARLSIFNDKHAKKLSETGQIWGLHELSGKRKEGMAWNLAYWWCDFWSRSVAFPNFSNSRFPPLIFVLFGQILAQWLLKHLEWGIS